MLTFSNNLQLLAQCDTQAQRQNRPLSSMWRGQKLTAGNEIFPKRWSTSPEHGDTASGKTLSPVPVRKCGSNCKPGAGQVKREIKRQDPDWKTCVCARLDHSLSGPSSAFNEKATISLYWPVYSQEAGFQVRLSALNFSYFKSSPQVSPFILRLVRRRRSRPCGRWTVAVWELMENRSDLNHSPFAPQGTS